MHSELIVYRADPSNRNLSRLQSAAKPWLYAHAGRIVAPYRNLSMENDGPDLMNEGLLSMSNAARRFFHQCPRCKHPFLRRSRLDAHLRQEHHIRGEVPGVVSLFTFAKWSARLAMKRTAARMVSQDVPTEDVDVGRDEGFEGRLAVEMMIHRAMGDLSARAREEVFRILDGEVLATGAAPVAVRDELELIFSDIRPALKEAAAHGVRG